MRRCKTKCRSDSGLSARLLFYIVGVLFVLLFWEIASFAQGANPGGRQRSPMRAGADREAFVAGRTAYQSALQNARHYFGFSLGIQEAYDGNVFGSAENIKSDFVANVQPRTFLNLGNRRSQFHLDYGFGYRNYTKQDNLDSLEHNGSAHFSTRLSRRLTMSFSDSASYSRDYGESLSGSGWGLSGIPVSPSSEVLLPNQNIQRNVLTARLEYQLGRRAQLSGWGTYNLYTYQNSVDSDSRSVLAGFSYDHQINRWLDFSSNISTYIVSPEDNLANEGTQTNRLQLIGFNTRLNRNWTASANGALEFAKERARRTLGFGFAGAISRINRNNRLNIEYSHGFTGGIGWSRTFRSHTARTEFQQGLTSRIRMQIASIYNRSNEVRGSSMVENYRVQSGMEFILRQDLIATANYNFQRQTTSHLDTSVVQRIWRPMGTVSLQYIIPLIGR
jgi:hypothetical protein